MEETFNAQGLGQITITEETIRWNRHGQTSQWQIKDFFDIEYWRYVSVDGVLFETLPECNPELFEQVVSRVIGWNLDYLNHPIIRAWIKYNQQMIHYLRQSAVPLSDERIQKAADRLKAVGGNAAVKAAKQPLKKTEKIFAIRFDKLLAEGRRLHELWWSSRKLYHSRRERQRYVIEQYDPDEGFPDDVFEFLPTYDEERVARWALPWIQIFENPLCSELKRREVHLRQAVRLRLKQECPGASLANLSRGRKSPVA
jgi:hypothetical protein